MIQKKILSNGTEVYLREDGSPWYWIPPKEVKRMKELDELWKKQEMEALWGKKSG